MTPAQIKDTIQNLATTLNVPKEEFIYCSVMNTVLLKKRCEDRRNKQVVKRGLHKNNVIMMGGTFHNKKNTSFSHCDNCFAAELREAYQQITTA